MTLEELLKAKELTDDQIKAILDGMKENKIFTASEENLDIRYGKLKTDYDNLTTQNGEWHVSWDIRQKQKRHLARKLHQWMVSDLWI